MHDFAILIEILSPLGGDGNVAPAPIISLEEGERVAAGYDTSTLVVEKRRRITLEDRDIMTERKKSESNTKTA